MPPQSCATHPAAAAVYRCDGCGRLLCPDCVQEGHRLLFCRHCRERALPLVGLMFREHAAALDAIYLP
jgi:DNA-directed RNA polymerase subunit RPC12/RpoP